MSLLLQNVCLPLANFTLELDVEFHGRITAIFGPSGAGKTSLLDLIAGLRAPRSARIRLGDRMLTDTATGIFIPAPRRGIGYVPQDLALFPHLSVRQNVLYGIKKGAEANPLFALNRIVDLLEIGPLIQRGVGRLSGGEQQRVALARALLASPRLLLLDEPLANLDLPLKTRILPFLTRIRDEFSIPMLYVTHDRLETLSLADDIIVLAGGRVVQSGPPKEVFNRPANRTVAGIVAVETIQPGRVIGSNDGLVSVEVNGILLSSVGHLLPADARDVYVSIRAEDVILLRDRPGSSSPRNHLAAVVRAIQHMAPMVRVELDCGFPLTALLTSQACSEMELAPGARVIALVKAPHIHLIPR